MRDSLSAPKKPKRCESASGGESRSSLSRYKKASPFGPPCRRFPSNNYFSLGIHTHPIPALPHEPVYRDLDT
ncbi:hypothetical protein IAQ61_004761 [Plenodomus lingam]|uniref:uncharacterized protein n=1 Tax=Leptosphaeria maculans TaxID=5022 RepID=UPI00333079EC|nr:hypothetical protein IAQ61_004761 [Plenodomus lingam]